MQLTIYTKGCLLLVLYVGEPADLHTEVGKPVLGPKLPLFVVNLPQYLPNLDAALSITWVL
jgi:hypothetical protein